VLLCTHPEERQKLAADPGLIDRAVEEILRYRSPLEGLFRTATDDVELAGCPIPKGAKIRVVWASANHDEQQFEAADRFIVDRDPAELRKHVAFGLGPHSCLGAALARAELRIALSTLLRRLPDLDLDPADPPVRNKVLTINGYVRVPVRWDPSAAQPAATA
jgi:cytochrome P450